MLFSCIRVAFPLRRGTFNCTAAHRIDFQKQGDANLRVDIPCQKCTVKAGSSKLQLTDSASEAIEIWDGKTS